jgi:UDP-N-acetylmuramoylalanine--D-glutamate ligase
MDLSRLKDQTFLIVGLGKTGLAIADQLHKNSIPFYVFDDNPSLLNEAQNYRIFSSADWPDIDELLLSPGIPHHFPKPHPLALEAQKRSVPIICDVDIFARTHVHNKMIGITGTNGKSTTTALTHHSMAQFRPCAMGGNIGTPVLTLPDLSADQPYILELSSYQLERVPHLQLDVGVLLNITPDHLDRHGSMAGYVEAKKKIFERLKPQGLAILGVDTPDTKKLQSQFKDLNLLCLSTQNILPHGVSVVEGLLRDQRDGQLVFEADLTPHPVLKGQHNFENMAACYAILRYGFDIKDQDILSAMMSFTGLAHRQYHVGSIGSVDFINDSKATNAEAAAKALASYHPIFWIAGGQAKDGGLSGLERFKDRVIKTYLIGEAQQSFATWCDQNGWDYTLSGDLERAMIQALSDASAYMRPSVVLLSPACASWDQFRSFEHRGQVFEDIFIQLKRSQNV